jgi:hypothetical protein
MIVYLEIRTFLSFFYTIGVFTSLWNHGTTSEYAKWSDRIFMFIGVFVDIVVIKESAHSMEYFIMLATPVLLYLKAKDFESKKSFIL